MDEMFDKLIRNELTPNQFYLLYSIKENQTAPMINTSLELRILKSKNWILENGKLSAKAIKLVKEIESYFKRLKKKTNKVIMGDNFEENIVAYNDMWPKMKLPSSKAARSAKGNLVDPFRWFFQNFEFTWDEITKATALYLDEKEAANWNYCRTSQYFVRKQKTDKSWESELADYCQLIQDGGDKSTDAPFKETVF